MRDIPEGFTALEYARNLLEETLGWPAKSNLEMIADCITALSKSKKLTLPQSLAYLRRAVRLAQDQGQAVTRLWFMDGEYLHVRPPKVEQIFRASDRIELEKHQATPEWQAAAKELRDKFRELVRGKSL